VLGPAADGEAAAAARKQGAAALLAQQLAGLVG
jgi:hypothetical protein